MHHLPRLAVLPLLLSVALCAPVFAGAVETQRVAEAVKVLDELMLVPEQAIPDSLLSKSYAVAVIPGVIKAGLVFGGRRGHGLISVRSADGTWSAPAFITLTGGSIGFQAGVQSSDVILVFRSPRGVDSIVNGKFTLGADAAVAAGPLGRRAEASTDGNLKAEIYSYSRARGLFAGIAVDGAVLAIDHDANQSVYGRNATPRAIFEGRTSAPGGNAVVDFRDRLEEYTSDHAATPLPATAPRPTATAQPQLPPQPVAQPQPFESLPADAPAQAIPLDD